MSWQQWVIIGIAAAVLGGCGGSSSPPRRSNDEPALSSPEQMVAAARIALQRRDFARASLWIQRALVVNPGDVSALELAADVAVQGGDHRGALDFYQRAADASDAPSRSLLDKLGQLYMTAGRPFQSVAVLQTAIASYPDDAGFRQRLVGLLAALGLEAESVEHMQWLVQRGHGDVNLLIILSDLSRPQTVESTCRYALEQEPGDLRPWYSLARLPAYHGQWSEAAQQLKPVIERHPDFVSAHAHYARAIVELDDPQAIAAWSESLPSGIESHPQYWLAAGIWAERNAAPEQAAAAFWRAARLQENDGEALSRLSASLARLGQSSQSQSVAWRAAKINSLRAGVDSLLEWHKDSQSAAVQIARTLDELGRRWEATAWLQAAFRMTRNKDPQLEAIYQSVRGQLTGKTPWQVPERLVAAPIDLSHLPSPHWWQAGPQVPDDAVAVSPVGVRFADQAAARGLNHVCELSKPAGQEAGLAIYQSGAGGAGVIDFDLDGWPDVCLTSMDGTPMQTDSAPNRIFRNQSGRFVDVTTASQVLDRGFAQGIAVGDYNADGLPDLLFANIGGDRLFRNNGDGTFAEATGAAGLSGQQWTTSALIADIDGDGHADLFQVGYCAGAEPFERLCQDAELQEPRSCSPLTFDAQPDRVWRGRGDGTFTDATADWLAAHEAGRGMGIVAGELDQNRGLDIYIANDMTANHFWSRDNSAARYRLTEQASLRGLAFNERSLSQASMGIAAGDADNDGDLDFLLTHFSGDYNTYYEQVATGIWADHSRRVGLAAPSLRMLGYGTQWIDADNDGSVELLVGNGDIDDFTHEGRFFRQPFQIFQRLGDGSWRELDRDGLGEYFRRDYLARAVIVLDADRDGRSDFLVTHLFDPVALLINQARGDAGRTRFFLRGRDCHRDAIGARVTISAGGQTRTGQLLAGDGYQCSNERCVSFGLGQAAGIDRATVHWPDGSSETWEGLAVGCDYLLVQGGDGPFAWVP
jgi:tetratricopeptide (TPR) repeat protein